MKNEQIENHQFRISDAERASYKHRFFEVSGEVCALIEEKNSVRRRCDQKIRERQAELDSLRKVLESGVETRRVAVTYEKDLAKGTLLVRRVDTGEALYVRPLSVEELQADLPFVSRRPADVVQLRAAVGEDVDLEREGSQ